MAINKYLSDLSTNGFWGDAECLAAASNLKKLKINVYCVDTQSKVIFIPTSGNHNTEINLLYTGSHYDSLKLDSDRIPLTTSTGQSSGLHNMTENVHRRIIPADNPYTLIDEPLLFKSPDPNLPISSFCLGTWNVRGLNNSQKRDTIDSILLKNNVHICSIQETNMSTGACSSKNYTWHHTNETTTKRRGVGIAVRKHTLIQTKRIKSYFGAILTLHGKIVDGIVLFIAVYVPPHTSQFNRRLSSRIFSKLLSIIDRCPPSHDIVLLGDFNAHLSRSDSYSENENGIALELLTRSTQLFNHTLHGRRRNLITWKDRRTHAQLDYILTRKNNRYIYVKSAKAAPFYPAISDHRLLWLECIIRNPPRARPDDSVPVPKPSISPQTYTYKTLNLLLLQDTKISSLYQTNLSNSYAQAISTSNTHNLWPLLTACIKITSQQVLTTKTPLTPKRRRALALFKQAQYHKNTHPHDPSARERLQLSRRRLSDAYSSHRSMECLDFFSNLTRHSPSDRFRRTYSFFKQFKRTHTSDCVNYIPLSSWVGELRKSEGKWPKLLEETDYCPLGPPPTMEEIQYILKYIRPGTAPGPDGIPIELFKHAPDNVIEALHKVIETAWIQNEPPIEWFNTVQVPIPKIKSPRRIEDYRRITLCNSGYKIYSKILLDKLDDHLDLPPTYQAAFLTNRSADDHMFAVR